MLYHENNSLKCQVFFKKKKMSFSARKKNTKEIVMEITFCDYVNIIPAQGQSKIISAEASVASELLCQGEV